MRLRNKGVTLIELMVVIIIVATLASIAIPSYRQYVLRTHRTEAKSALLNLASAQERFYLECNRYTTNLTGPINGTCGTLATPGTRGLGMPESTGSGYYTLAIANGANATTFDATATAAGSQADDSACASLSIDAQGNRTATKSGGGVSTVCWD